MKSGFVTDFNEKRLGLAEKYLQKFIIVWLTDQVSKGNSSNETENNDKLQIFVGLQKGAQNIHLVRDLKNCLELLRKC